jgi:hypothetical protein
VLYEARPGEFAQFATLAARRYADTGKFRRLEHEDMLRRLARLKAEVQ